MSLIAPDALPKKGDIVYREPKKYTSYHKVRCKYAGVSWGHPMVVLDTLYTANRTPAILVGFAGRDLESTARWERASEFFKGEIFKRGSLDDFM